MVKLMQVLWLNLKRLLGLIEVANSVILGISPLAKSERIFVLILVLALVVTSCTLV